MAEGFIHDACRDIERDLYLDILLLMEAEGKTMDDKPAYDIHCPLMGDGLNYWKKACELRQKNPDLKLTCYPKCKASEVKTRTENTVKHNPHNGTTKKVIALAKSGMATGDIATELDIEPGTVSRYKWLAQKRGLL